MIPTYVLYTYHAIWCLTPDFTGWSPELCWSPDKLPPPRCISNGLCTPALWPGWCWQTDHLCLRVRLLVPPFHVQYVYYIYIYTYVNMILNMWVIYVHLLLTLELAHASEAMFTWRGVAWVGLLTCAGICAPIQSYFKPVGRFLGAFKPIKI
jgi:hypothetical protein